MIVQTVSAMCQARRTIPRHVAFGYDCYFWGVVVVVLALKVSEQFHSIVI
jgi:hypothetical protein